MLKKLIFAVISILLIMTGCSNTSSTSKTKEKIAGVPDGVQGGIKIAVIRNLPSDDHTKQFLDGARTEGESFGFQVDTFISDGDDSKFQDLVNQAIQKDYDGLIISHGKEAYSYEMIKPALDKGMKVVTFDTVAKKNGKTLDGVTATAQNDAKLAQLSLDEVVKYGKNGQPARVIKLWLGGIPPLDNRNVVYKKYEQEGKIKTLETIGPSNMQDVQGTISSGVSAILSKYPKGTVDAIWGSWDEMTKGGFKALKDTNRSDINVVSIDVSNQDINLMTENGSVWRSTAAVDPRLIGVMDMRLLAKKLAGVDVPATYELEPSLIKQENLTSDTTMDTLKNVIDGWGKSNDFDENWMKKLRDSNSK
jgi:simple sugar transport system substrate-binding protein